MVKTNQTFKNKFPGDAHDVVMIVRTVIEFVVFVVFVFLSSKIQWVQRFPQLKGLKIGVSSALIFSIIFLVLVIYRKSRGKSVKGVVNFEAIGDAILIIWLIFIFGGMNGPFFFFFFLALMETAFTLSLRAILIVALLGIFSLVGEYIFGVYRGNLVLDVQSFLFLFFRLVSISLISYYSYSFVRSIAREKKVVREIEKLAAILQVAKKKAEKAYGVEKKARKELKRLDDAKTQFLMATQHHLRTPLTSMIGYLDLIFRGTYGKIPLKLKETLKKFQTSTKNEIKIVSELLDISQFQLGKEIVTLRPNIQIEPILREIIEELRFEVENKGIYLKLIEPKTKIPSIKADLQKLKVALANIIDNAVKYTDKGGVTVNIKNESKLQIIVKDTGMGISKEELNTLFTRIFERSKEAKKVYTTGKGIGLYITSKIIEAHKGDIWAESEGKGKGSSFYVELPVE